MLAWKQERQGKSALLIKGARRIGKSTIVRTFAEREYKSYILIDFSKASKAVTGLFDDLMNLDFIFLRLQSIYQVVLERRKSVIIFDEVQLCPKARQAIKHLVADGRYDYIETGSLISIKKNIENIIIPSEETRLEMFPMDYEEKKRNHRTLLGRFPQDRWQWSCGQALYQHTSAAKQQCLSLPSSQCTG